MEQVRSIAYYLPQFHQIPENDEWWGEGFTEWTNVKKAKPAFDGHEQLLPTEYYDLSNISVLHNQIKLAKKFGLYGFCFHYYWFNKKRLLEKPIENYLADQSESCNFPFMLCWANENWTRRWDGRDDDILIGQQHSVQDHKDVADDLIRYMKDPRYIKVNGKPALMIYRPALIDHFNKFVDILKYKAKLAGLGGVHLIASNAFKFKRNDNDEDKQFNVDAVAEFPPHFSCDAIKLVDTNKLKNYNGTSRVYDYGYTVDAVSRFYKKIVTSSLYRGVSYYPGVFPSWDNTARKQNDSDLFTNVTVEKFRQWLSNAKQFTELYNTGDKLMFINAWNEWAEGAVLEPTLQHGDENLHALRDVMSNKIHDKNKVNAIQIFYHESQRESLLQDFKPHYNLLATINLESGIIRDLVSKGEADSCDWFGVFSWRAQDKIKRFCHKRLLKVVDDRFDLITCSPNHWDIGESRVKKKHYIYDLHVEIWPLMQLLIKKLHENKIIPTRSVLQKKDFFIYCNYFIAKNHVYKDYVESLLIPAMDLLEHDDELRILSREAPKTSYPDPPRRFTEHTGFTYYPHKPFVLERLINIYTEVNEHIKVGRLI